MVNWVEIGNATIALGDCREIIPTLNGIDVCITDPPYGISVSGSSFKGPRGTRRLDFFPGDDDSAAMVQLARETIERVILLNPLSLVVWCSHRQIDAIVSAMKSAKYSTRMLFWRKKCPPPAPPGTGFSSAMETAIYGYKSGRHWDSGQYESNVFDCDSYRFGQPGKVDHPTQKPLMLIEWNVNLLTPPGGLVLDPFMGSGTTGVACLKLGRRFIGIEKEQKYFDIAAERLKEAYNQPNMFLEPNKARAQQEVFFFP